MKWPGPMRALTRAYRKAKTGDVIELLSTECAIEAVSKAWCERTGNKALRAEMEPDGVFIVAIQVGGKPRGEGRASEYSTRAEQPRRSGERP
ncbi:MAG: sulfurtransferase TusA family protein [Nitrososphaerota archaeon]|nr:sulfurtransferase TusA family protein [Nitrososphaerota archaeon]